MIPFFQPPAAYTRTRSIKSQLLKDEDWQALEHTDNLTSALNALLNTSYATYFDFSLVQSDNLPLMRDVEHILRNSYISSSIKILRFLHGSQKDFLICFIQKYELLNLKKTIRRLSKSAEIDYGLKLKNYNLGRFSLLRKTNWDEIKDFKQLGKLLDETYYQFSFRKGYAQFTQTNDFFLFETLLEKVYYDELIIRSKGLGISDFLNIFFDEICLSSFLRFRFEFDMEAPAILPLIPIKGSSFFSEKLFWKISELEDADEVFDFLKMKVKGKNLKEKINHIKKNRQIKCRKIFITASPLNFLPVLSYCFLKELEVAELIMLLQRKRFGITN